MSKKYIIKNCPCYQDNKGMNCISPNGYYYCQYVPDCKLKQIVELCKGVESIENVETLYDAAQSGMFLQANRILKLLDIEECE